jgi:serine kinase of HPr protein (carbohydrate metabolism regulator)
LHDEQFEVLGVDVPLIRMPVAPGRNIAILVEVAARNHLLKERGYDAARHFAERVDEMVGPVRGTRPGRRAADLRRAPRRPAVRRARKR